MKSATRFWFKVTAVAGIAVAALLFVDTVLAYRYVSSRLARDQGMLLAVEEVSALEHELRRGPDGNTVDGLRRILREMAEDRSDEIAWISVLTTDLRVEASGGLVEPHGFPPADRIRAVTQRNERYSTVHDTSREKVLIALLPLKTQAPARPAPDSATNARIVEIGIYLKETEGVLHPLGRNLLISTLAALALLAAMIVLMTRLPSYARGRALQHQLQLARSVQRRLLPESAPGDIEFAAECVPADEVGGDFYDVFSTDTGETVLVLADVSGKGLPAALRMGVVHGAIRALSAGKKDAGVAALARRLNELLREATSREFVTLFWGFYNRETHELQYVNAGHLPPLLVAKPSGDVRRLETGGPVLGVLPRALYQDERLKLNGEETLIAYSDGLLEATRPDGEELGEQRLLPAVRSSTGKAAAEVLRTIMGEAERFIEGGEFHDDLTVFVAKLGRDFRRA